MKETALTTALARVASVPFRLFGRSTFMAPRKAVILKPCCLSQAMLTTPLLAALSEAYPRAQFDWVVQDYARPAVASNVRLSELVDAGRVGLPEATMDDVRELARRLRQQGYDTCFIPSDSAVLALVAWLARIRQRVGLSGGGRGFAHTLPVKAPPGERHTAAIYLSLARVLGIEAPGHMEFFARDDDRAAMTQLLVDEASWLGDVPLVLLHPGGGHNPVQTDERKRWPVERFALLANYLLRRHEARILLVGAEADRPAARAVAGMTSGPSLNLAGQLNLGEVGALCEVASLYVGNDTGPTHVAAAVGCATLAIFGPSDPAVSAPYATKGHVAVLQHEGDAPFSWENTALPHEAIEAAEHLLQGAAGEGRG
jgi:lipopolysaccharide heptosyltransferase II